MAIRLRRGSFSDLDTSRLLSGELAVVLDGDPAVTDGRALYVCFGSVTKRVATWEDAAQLIAAAITEGLELTIASSNDAISVTSSNGSYTLSHKAPYSSATEGLDPTAGSLDGRTGLGSTDLGPGDGFYVPAVSIDRYGHVTAVRYRRLVLPGTGGVATLDDAGVVRPDGSTILVTVDGVISVPMATAEVAGLLSAAHFSRLAGLDEALAAKAPLASPALTGTPTAPTAASGTDSTQIATTAFVQDAIGSLATGVTSVAGKTGDVTLEKADISDLAAATTSEGGLMSASDKSKLDGVASGAQANVIETVKVNGTALTPTDKAVDVTVPTASDSDPSMDGTASAGTASSYSRGDHVHPTDTTRAPIASPEFTGEPKAPTPTAGDSSTKLATTAFVQSAVSDPTRESTGEVSGPLLAVSAEGWATQDTTTGKNLLDFNSWKSVGTYHGTAVWGDGRLTLTATSNDCYTNYDDGSFPSDARISVSEGDVVTLSWKSDSNKSGEAFIFGNGNASKNVNVDNATAKSLSYTVPAGVTFLTFRFGVATSGESITYYDIQLEAGSTATGYEPYTGGAPSPSPDYPQEIKVARGRNLAEPNNTTGRSHEGCTWAYAENGEWNVSGSTGSSATSFPDSASKSYKAHLRAGTYVASTWLDGSVGLGVRVGVSSSSAFVGSSNSGVVQFTVTEENDYYILPYIPTSTSVNGRVAVQLELGSTPSPYVPYGHVGMEVRDSQDALLSCTPIPLPPRGWVGSLPDGTADALRLDVAGHVVWELPTSEVVLDGSSDEGWGAQSSAEHRFYGNVPSDAVTPTTKGTTSCFVTHFRPVEAVTGLSTLLAGQCVLCTSKVLSIPTLLVCKDDVSTVSDMQTWLSTHPVTVLYPLATPTTEDCGYVDMPDITGECQVSIPELAALGVKWSLSQVPMEVGVAFYRRAYSEYENRIAALEAAVAALATE